MVVVDVVGIEDHVQLIQFDVLIGVTYANESKLLRRQSEWVSEWPIESTKFEKLILFFIVLFVAFSNSLYKLLILSTNDDRTTTLIFLISSSTNKALNVTRNKLVT